MDMNGLSQAGYLNSVVSGYQNGKNNTVKNEKTNETEKNKASELKNVSGRTIGEPKLSEKAAKYYEQLKKKYHNMDFILVSPDKKAEAERNKGMYQSSKELLVLIDSDKIEKMAEDEEYRKKYESILNGATSQMNQMKASLGSKADSVKSFGMTFNDHGNASFFAVIDKSYSAQRERISAKRQENAKAKKEAEKKKAEKKEEEKRAEEKKSDSSITSSNADQITVSAPTWDELLAKIDNVLAGKEDRSLADMEKLVGQRFDYTI